MTQFPESLGEYFTLVQTIHATDLIIFYFVLYLTIYFTEKITNHEIHFPLLVSNQSNFKSKFLVLLICIHSFLTLRDLLQKFQEYFDFSYVEFLPNFIFSAFCYVLVVLTIFKLIFTPIYEWVHLKYLNRHAQGALRESTQKTIDGLILRSEARIFSANTTQTQILVDVVSRFYVSGTLLIFTFDLNLSLFILMVISSTFFIRDALIGANKSLDLLGMGRKDQYFINIQN